MFSCSHRLHHFRWWWSSLNELCWTCDLNLSTIAFMFASIPLLPSGHSKSDHNSISDVLHWPNSSTSWNGLTRNQLAIFGRIAQNWFKWNRETGCHKRIEMEEFKLHAIRELNHLWWLCLYDPLEWRFSNRPKERAHELDSNLGTV